MIDDSVYCSMLHGGLYLHLEDTMPWVEACCLRPDDYAIEVGKPFWPINQMQDVRTKNLSGIWDPGCQQCHSLEAAGMRSFRQGMNHGLGIFGRDTVSGPARIDIMFDISCNLACRTCGPELSTFWQKQLKSLGEWHQPIRAPKDRQQVIDVLATLDLSNLRQVVFCGGETLLGQEYWEVARWLTEHTPRAKQNLMLCFQTNGTRPISQQNFDVIESCKLIKLQVSIDGIGPRFEYLRWPASWTAVRNNLMYLRQHLPGNVMFLVEQTISIFNVLYLDDVDRWVRQTFDTPGLDPVDCTRHLAWGPFSIKNSSQELMNMIHDRGLGELVEIDWREDSDAIRSMLSQIKKFDAHRDQRFQDIFPELFACFKRFW